MEPACSGGGRLPGSCPGPRSGRAEPRGWWWGPFQGRMEQPLPQMWPVTGSEGVNNLLPQIRAVSPARKQLFYYSLFRRKHIGEGGCPERCAQNAFSAGWKHFCAAARDIVFLILRSGLECDVSWHRALKDQVDSNLRARWLTDPGMLVVSAHDRHLPLLMRIFPWGQVFSGALRGDTAKKDTYPSTARISPS